MYLRKRDIINNKILIQPGENLVEVEVQNRPHLRIAENADTVYEGVNNLADLIGISLAALTSDTPKYLSNNYIRDGMSIKEVIEVLDRTIYNIYTMTITTPVSGSAQVSDNPDYTTPASGNSDASPSDYNIKVNSIDRIYKEGVSTNKIDPFSIGACFFRNAIRVIYGQNYRSDLGNIGLQNYMQELVSTNYGTSFIKETNILQTSILSSYGGIGSVTYTDIFGYERYMINYSSTIFAGNAYELNSAVRYNTGGGYTSSGEIPKPTPSSYILVIDTYLDREGNVFTITRDTDKGPFVVYKKSYSSEINASPGLANYPVVLSVPTSADNINNGALIYDQFDINLGKWVMYFVYASSNGVYSKQKSVDKGDTWVSDGFFTDFSIDDSIGSPTALLLVNDRVLIANIGYNNQIPYLDTYLMGADYNSWKTTSYDLSSYLPSDASTRARKVALVQTGAAEIFAFFVDESEENIEVDQIYKIRMSLV